MKKVLLSVAVAGFIAVGFTSCKKNECIECNGTIVICEDEYKESTAGATIPWSTYKASATMSPDCKVVDGE